MNVQELIEKLEEVDPTLTIYGYADEFGSWEEPFGVAVLLYQSKSRGEVVERRSPGRRKPAGVGIL